MYTQIGLNLLHYLHFHSIPTTDISRILMKN